MVILTRGMLMVRAYGILPALSGFRHRSYEPHGHAFADLDPAQQRLRADPSQHPHGAVAAGDVPSPLDQVRQRSPTAAVMCKAGTPSASGASTEPWSSAMTRRPAFGCEDPPRVFSEAGDSSSAVPEIRPTCMPELTLSANTSVYSGRIALISAGRFTFIVFAFDACRMSRERSELDRDRLVVAELNGAAKRHAQWRDLTQAETETAVAELREIAGARSDLLAETAGILLGVGEGRLDEPVSQAAAQLCIAAGADERLIPGWIQEGRHRAENRRRRSFPDPARRAERDA